MALAQMQAVTGRRIRPRYRDIIEGQVPYLQDRYRLKKQTDLQERGLTLQEQNMLKNEALAREALEEEKKQARISNLISLGNLGLKTGLGAYSVFGDKGGFDEPAVSSPSGPASALDAKLSFDVPETSGTTVPFLSKSGLLDTSKWKGAFTEGSTYAGGGIGTLAARTLGKKQSTLTRGLIGAGVGGVASALFSEGDPYSSVVGGIMGGLGGIF